MKTRTLGRDGPVLSALGLGCMGMSDFYGPADDNVSIATIHAAMEASVTLFDTGDFYGSGHNEMLLAKALGGHRDKAFIQVKFGAMRDPAGGFTGFDTRPAAIKNSIAYSLKRLKTDCIDLYMPARIDPSVPIEDVAGTISDLIKAGHVRYFGLSEAGSANIRRAHAVHPVTALQIEYSLAARGIERDILPACRELGIGVTAYGVLGRGLLSGRMAAGATYGATDFRTRSPRFQGENFAANLRLVDKLAAIAAAKGVTAAQLAVAWALSRGEDILPLVGARRPESLAESFGATEIALTPQELAAIEAAMPAGAVAGTRYDAHGMQSLDSEKG